MTTPRRRVEGVRAPCPTDDPRRTGFPCAGKGCKREAVVVLHGFKWCGTCVPSSVLRVKRKREVKA
jgi:hypothetical protein